MIPLGQPQKTAVRAARYCNAEDMVLDGSMLTTKR